MEKTDQTEAFWQKVKEANPDAGDDYRVRSLGADQAMAEMLFDLIKTGDKSGTFGLKGTSKNTRHLVPERCRIGVTFF